MLLSTAASALRHLPPFEHVSLRLLQDLVEFASVDVDETTLSDRPRKGDAWLTTQGNVEVGRRPPAQPRRVPAGRIYVHHRGDRRYAVGTGWGPAVRGRRFKREWMKDAAAASFTLARSLTPSPGLLGISVLRESTLAHRIFLAAHVKPNDDVGLPVEALGGLLAAGISAQFWERSAVVVLDEDGSVKVRRPPLWRSFKVAGDRGGKRTPDEALEATLKHLADQTAKGTGWHLIFVHPAVPGRPPRRWKHWFHRIVWATRAWGPNDWYPHTLFPYLLHDAWPAKTRKADAASGPFFCSFIPTVIGPARPQPLPWSSWLPWPLGGQSLATLNVAPIGESSDFVSRFLNPRKEPLAARVRLFRDRCRVVLPEKEELPHWSGDDAKHFVEAALAHPQFGAGVKRWGRAVTNRQVGLALSGGGASSAALVPLIRDLFRERDGMPLDVVSGVSGGTLLGAFLCQDDPGGLAEYLKHGWRFQLALAGAVLHSWSVERTVDWLLGGARVEDLQTRLVAITTELCDRRAPRGDPKKRVRGAAVVGGTLGEAVRVSGASPLLFGPAVSATARYLDGATAVPVPARVLPDFGADMVFAFNSIPGVDHPNLLLGLLPRGLRTVADFLYRRLLVGRFADGLTAFFTTLEQASQEAAEDADVFYEVRPAPLPLSNGFWWASLDEVVKEIEKRPTKELADTRSEGERRWQAFSTHCSRQMKPWMFTRKTTRGRRRPPPRR